MTERSGTTGGAEAAFVLHGPRVLLLSHLWESSPRMANIELHPFKQKSFHADFESHPVDAKM